MDVCEKLNMKYNVRVFLPESAKGTSEVTQNALFILRGLMQNTTPNYVTYRPAPSVIKTALKCPPSLT